MNDFNDPQRPDASVVIASVIVTICVALFALVWGY